MSADGSISFDWADGRYTFRLAWKELQELQEKTGFGPYELAERIRSHRWRVDDLREAIRLGLIGGGMKPEAALKLVRRHVEGRSLLESERPAYVILMAALTFPASDPVGKASAEGVASGTIQTDVSPSPPSTGPEPQ